MTFRLKQGGSESFFGFDDKAYDLEGREDFLRFFTRAFVALEQHDHSLCAFGVEVHGGIVGPS